MEKNKLISIIIPAYNAGKSLTESLDSLVRQSYKNFEAIIVDDGSKDNTSEIGKKYILQDNRFKYHYQENRGVSAARNKGISLSSGEYICFLDADDYFDGTFLQKMYKRIQETDNEVCYCGYNIVSSELINKKKTLFKNGDILLEKILGRINIHTTGWMIKKKLLIANNITFTEGVSWGEDFEFFNEIVAVTDKICFVGEHLTNYKVDHDDNQLSSFSLDKIDKDYESIMRIVNNKKINKNKAIENALINYRLQALIVYRLVSAVDIEVDKNEIKLYYEKYKEYIKEPTFNNGLRSIKLTINKIKLLFII